MRSDDEFLETLRYNDLKDEYRREKIQLVQLLKKSAQDSHEERIALLRSATETERAHRDLQNLCVFPFTERGQAYRETGYQYLRSAPLLEMRCANFDFLLYRTDPRRGYAAIFGEVKASIDNSTRIINEVRMKSTFVQQHLNYIRQQYFQIPPNTPVHLEYVVAVHSIDTHEIVNAISKSGGGVIVWQAERAGTDEIRAVFPSETIPNRVSMIHAYKEMAQVMRQISSSRVSFGILPQSHPLLSLQALIAAAKLEKIVERADLIAVLQRDLFWLSLTEIEAKADEIISLGKQIGFLIFDEIVSHHRIIANGYRRRFLEKSLEEKWYEFRASMLEKEEYERRISELQQIFQKKQDSRPTLAKWA